MSLLVYGITDRERVDGSGIDGMPLSLIRSSGVGAVVTSVVAALTGEKRMWAYERVVETLMESGTILPARFGTVLEHEHAARAFLDRHHDEFDEGLVRVRGAVEMGVRAQWKDAVGASTSGDARRGTSYLLNRLALLRSARRIVEQLARLDVLARRTRVSVLPRPGVPVLGAYLVDRDRADEFLEECDRLNGQLEAAELVCTGPWPPYSFTSGDEGS